MKNPFKKNHMTKEQRQEQKRRENMLKEFSKHLVTNCENAQDLYTRVDIVVKQIDQRGAQRLEDYKRSMGEERFGDWELTAQEGRGRNVEQMVIDFFEHETVAVAETLMDTWKRIHDASVRKELLERKPDTLNFGFKNE